MTTDGQKALLDYEALRVQRIAELLHHLGEEDQEELVRMLDKLRTLLERGTSA
jgi:DNA-binding MarR family transcriptional regulator